MNVRVRSNQVYDQVRDLVRWQFIERVDEQTYDHVNREVYGQVSRHTGHEIYYQVSSQIVRGRWWM